MPRVPDNVLKSADFKTQLQHADDWAETNGSDYWAARIVWISLVYGTLGARRYAQRRANYQDSVVWAYYQNLTNAGILSEDPEGIAWSEGTEPWESDPMLWFTTLVHIATGVEPPEGFSRLAGDIP